MGNKTIYVKDDKLWNAAKKRAGKDGLSGVIQKALSEFVKEKALEEAGFSLYRLEVGLHVDEYVSGREQKVGPTERIAFEGQLLAAEMIGIKDMELDPEEYFPVEACLYKTKAGKLILTLQADGRPEVSYHYGVYDGLRSLAEDPELKMAHPVDRAALLNKVSASIGDDWAVWIE